MSIRLREPPELKRLLGADSQHTMNQRKISLVFGVVILLLTAISLAGLYAAGRLDANFDQIHHSTTQPLLALDQIDAGSSRVALELLGYSSLAPNLSDETASEAVLGQIQRGEAAQYREAAASLRQALDDYEASAAGTSRRDLVNNVLAAGRDFGVQADEVYTAVADSALDPSLVPLMIEFETAEQSLHNAVGVARTFEAAEHERSHELSTRMVARFRVTNVLILLVAVTITVWLGVSLVGSARQAAALRSEIRAENAHLLGELTRQTKALLEASTALRQEFDLRAQTEAALRASEELFRTKVENSLAGVYVIQDGRFRYANPAMAAMFGYTQHEVTTACTPDLLTHPEDRTKGDSFRSGRLRGLAHVARHRFRGLHKDGSTIYLDSLGSRIEYDGAPAILGTLIDVTEQVEADHALRTSEQLFRSVITQALDGILVADADGTIVEWNRALEALTGYPREQVIGTPMWVVQHQLLPAKRRAAVPLEALQDGFRKIADNTVGSSNIDEVEIEDSDGQLHFLQSIWSPIRSPRERLISAVIRDVTEFKKFERAIRRRTHEVEILLELSDRIKNELDLPENIEALARAVLEVLPDAEAATVWLVEPSKPGLHLAGAAGDVVERVGELSLPAEHPVVTWMLGQASPESSEGLSPLPPLPFQDVGLDAPLTTMGQPIGVGEEVFGAIFAHNFSQSAALNPHDRKLLQAIADQAFVAIKNGRLLQTLTRHRQELQQLSARLLEAREIERRQISLELHDEVGQALTAASINLTTLEDALCETLDPAYSERLGEAGKLVDDVLEQVRALSLDLHPSMLDDLGLQPTLRWYTGNYSRRTGIQVELSIAGLSARLPNAFEIALYRISQEALTNVARHAGASRVYLSVVEDSTSVTLQVEDDGSGFQPQDVLAGEAQAGIGLVGIRERVTAFNGEFTLDSRPGGGTHLSVRLPRGT